MDSSSLKGLRRNLILIAALELVIGMFMIVFSDKSFDMMIKILGITAAAYGIITFLAWAVKKDKGNGVPIIITAILGVVAGALLIFLTEHVLGIFTFIAGIFAGIFGVIKLPNMFAVKKGGFRQWWIMLVPMAIIVGIGVFIGLNRNLEPTLSSVLLGIAMILGCASDIIAMAGAAAAEKQITSSPENNKEEL